MVLAAPLLVVLGCFVLVGLARANDYSLGALLASIGNWFKTQTSVTIAGFTASLAFIGDAILSLDNTIRNAIGQGIEAMAEPAVALVARVAINLEGTGQAIADVADSTARALEKLLRATIPAMIALRLASILQRLANLEADARFITHTVPKEITKVGAITKVYPVTVERVAGLPRLVKAAVAAAVGALTIPVAIPGTREILRGIDSIKADLKRLGKYATVSGLLGLVGAAVFSHFGLGWLRCSNVNKVGKSLCRMNRDLLDAFLAGLAVWLGTIGIEAFAKDVQAVTTEFEGEVRKFWRANVTGPGGDRTLGQTGL